ncbi:MAG: glycosyltransferase family 4 protein [Chlorobium phaeovibrioides]|nr:glycosyltransferase family 4 protein [Chlorobium phaeovibrioides]
MAAFKPKKASTPRIVVLTSSDFPYYAAPESFVRQMAYGLVENGVNLKVVRYWGDRYSNKNDTGIDCADYLFVRPAKNEFVKFLEFGIKLVYLPFFVGYCKWFDKRSAILLYGLDSSIFLVPAILCSKLFRIKLFRVITEIYLPDTYAKSWWRKPQIYFREWQLKYFDRFMDGVIVLSTSLRDLLVSNRVRPSNILLNPHFIDMGIVSEKKTDPVFRVGFGGTPTIGNGITDLIDAFNIFAAKVPSAELLIVGKIPSILNKALNIEIAGNSAIRVTGQLGYKDVIKSLSTCSVLVNPRRAGLPADTGFPTKVGEYFALKKPVINTFCGDLTLYLNDKEEVFFAEPNSPSSLADVILYAYNHPELSLAVGNAGYKWALRNLEYIRNTKKLIAFMQLGVV